MGMSERLPLKKKARSHVAAWEMTGIRPTCRTSVSKHYPFFFGRLHLLMSIHADSIHADGSDES
jgi:hypothetical protein